MTSYRVEYTPKVLKRFSKLDRASALRIKAFLDDLDGTENPRRSGKALVGDGQFWRYRVGDYRIIATIDDGAVVILVIEVAHRREVYR